MHKNNISLLISFSFVWKIFISIKVHIEYFHTKNKNNLWPLGYSECCFKEIPYDSLNVHRLYVWLRMIVIAFSLKRHHMATLSEKMNVIETRNSRH